MNRSQKNSARPLSPHLQIYKIQLTSLMSITHRLTGLGLFLALHLWVFWVWSLGVFPEGFIFFNEMMLTLPGQIVLWVSIGSLMYHLWNGVRHLLWDSGCGLDLKSVYATGYAVLVLSLFSTFLLWFYR